MLAKDIKTGTLVVQDGAPCLVKSVSMQTPSARGASVIFKYRCMHLLTKQKVDITLRGGDSLEEADFSRRVVKLMYTDSRQAHFLDQEDFNQYSLALDSVADDLRFLTDATEGTFALIYNDACVGIEPPLSVELEVTECDPGVRGDSATSRTKPATVETGLVIQVPEYLAQGERVKIDTRTGKYVSRA